MQTVERDFPVGHPAAPDYKGEKYAPPRAPWESDYDPDHPAFAGANCNATDTPDGLREHYADLQQDLDELIKVGAIPVDTDHTAATLAPNASKDEQAVAFLVSRNYSQPAAEALVKNIGADKVLAL